MSNSVVLEVAAGLALVFFIVATIASGVNQVLSRIADARAKTLWKVLEKLLTTNGLTTGADLGAVSSLAFAVNKNDARPKNPDTNAKVSTQPPDTRDWLGELLATPSLRTLDPVAKPGAHTKIDDIPPRVFATALLELAQVKGAADNASIEVKLLAVANAYPGTPLAAFLKSIASTVGTDLDKFLDTIGSWFDEQMRRLSAIYRKNTRWVLLGIGIVAVFVFNIDALETGRALKDDASTRSAVLLLAGDVAKTDVTGTCTLEKDDTRDPTLECGRRVLDQLSDLKLPVIGTWSTKTWTASWHGGFAAVLSHLVGLILSAGAVALGAPFWFDLLKWLTGKRGGAA